MLSCKTRTQVMSAIIPNKTNINTMSDLGVLEDFKGTDACWIIVKAGVFSLILSCDCCTCCCVDS